MTPAAETLRDTISKWDLLKLKSFCKAKDMVSKQNDSLQNGKISSSTPIRQRSGHSNIQRTQEIGHQKNPHNPIKNGVQI